MHRDGPLTDKTSVLIYATFLSVKANVQVEEL